MSLIPCPECKSEVSSEAATCPRCGVRVKPKSQAWRWFVGVPIALVVLFLLFGLYIPKDEAAGLRVFNACRDAFEAGRVASMQTCVDAERAARKGATPQF